MSGCSLADIERPNLTVHRLKLTPGSDVGVLVPQEVYSFTHAAVGFAMAAATFRFMQATAKTA